MIIIGTKAGQLGNRILLFAHFLANAIEYGYPLANPAFDEYADLFETTRRDLFCRHPSRPAGFGGSMLLRHLVYQVARVGAKLAEYLPANRWIKVIRLDSSESETNLASPEFIALRERHPVVVIKGWQYRDHLNLWKHRDDVRKFFRPVTKHIQTVESLLTSLRKDGAVVVGIHIRQGDYRNWAGGKYDFSTAEYVGMMRRMLDLLPDKKIRFLVCSNVTQDEKALAEFDHSIGLAHPVRDMYAMAGCDYMIGPPSTFSGWSSYYGNVPLFRMRTQNPEFSLESFDVYGKR